MSPAESGELGSVTTDDAVVGMRADIVVSLDPKDKVCADGEGRGREMICLSLKCCRSTFDAPFDIERVVDSSVGPSSSTSRLTTPNFGSPSPKNFIAPPSPRGTGPPIPDSQTTQTLWPDIGGGRESVPDRSEHDLDRRLHKLLYVYDLWFKFWLNTL